MQAISYHFLLLLCAHNVLIALLLIVKTLILHTRIKNEELVLGFCFVWASIVSIRSYLYLRVLHVLKSFLLGLTGI
jgi:hypothetical protein